MIEGLLNNTAMHKPLRRLQVAWLCGMLLATISFFPLQASAQSIWPLWQQYQKRFIQADGRVIEFSRADRSTSEAQAYALFHALVANDRDNFERILNWTNNNLAAGQLGTRLPAWLWGENDDGSWEVLDSNPASDADLWLAYNLLEAGRLWERPDYQRLGRLVLQQIIAEEIVEIDDSTALLIPAPYGFTSTNAQWQLNPSYWVPQQFRLFAHMSDAGLWQRLLNTTVKLFDAANHQGVMPDWTLYQKGKGFLQGDDVAFQYSSYDAIRVFLWVGTMSDQDPLKSRLLQTLRVDCAHPEKISLKTLKPSGTGPIGFTLAKIPFYQAKRADACLADALQRLSSAFKDGLLGDNPVYYDQNLAMFALGWLEKRYRFSPTGHLQVCWKNHLCQKSEATLLPASA